MHTSKLREKYQYISPLSQYILYFIVFSLFFAASTAIENAGKRLETKKNRSVLVRCQLYRQRCTWPGRSSRIRRCWLMYVQQNHDNSFRDNVKNTLMARAEASMRNVLGSSPDVVETSKVPIKIQSKWLQRSIYWAKRRQRMYSFAVID